MKDLWQAPRLGPATCRPGPARYTACPIGAGEHLFGSRQTTRVVCLFLGRGVVSEMFV